MYRLLRDAEQARERRAQAAHPARARPELVAAGPNEVWSWDITKLAGPQRGVYYHVYVMLDIFSRCAVHFEVHASELGELAKDFMTEAVRLNGGAAPLAIHADRGTSMTSKPVSALLSDLAILKSHSRPKVSNDNPYSEAVQDAEVLPCVSRHVRVAAGRPRVLRRFLHLLQSRAPAFRDRAVYPLFGPCRHRGRDPGQARGRAERRVRREPAALHPPPPGTQDARPGLNLVTRRIWV